MGLWANIKGQYKGSKAALRGTREAVFGDKWLKAMKSKGKAKVKKRFTY